MGLWGWKIIPIPMGIPIPTAALTVYQVSRQLSITTNFSR